MQSKVVNELDMFKTGPTETFMGPSGMEYTIRERNGEDEDILSKVKDNKEGIAITKFVASILVNPKLTEQDVKQLPSKDKYFILIKSRIMSLGNMLNFSWTFQGESIAYPFEVDLNQLVWDFNNPDFPKDPSHKEYSKHRCTPYPESIKTNPQFELSLVSSGKQVRMHYLTGVGESKILGKTWDEVSINDKLRIRGFEVKLPEGTWVKIERFNIFSTREMTEIRAGLMKHDEPFEGIVEVKNPKTGVIESVSVFQVEDFFFPTTL